MGTGSHQYIHDNYGLLSADYNIPYQWTLMPNVLSSSSSAEEISAVATLMYHCGVSVEMEYAPGVSGASSQQIPLSLHEYFGYSVSGIYKNKNLFSFTPKTVITAIIIKRLYVPNDIALSLSPHFVIL